MSAYLPLSQANQVTDTAVKTNAAPVARESFFKSIYCIVILVLSVMLFTHHNAIQDLTDQVKVLQNREDMLIKRSAVPEMNDLIKKKEAIRTQIAAIDAKLAVGTNLMQTGTDESGVALDAADKNAITTLRARLDAVESSNMSQDTSIATLYASSIKTEYTVKNL